MPRKISGHKQGVDFEEGENVYFCVRGGCCKWKRRNNKHKFEMNATGEESFIEPVHTESQYWPVSSKRLIDCA